MLKLLKGSAVGSLFEEAQLWSHKEGGRTVWRPDDYIIVVKLLFLVSLYKEYMVGEIDDEVEAFLKTLGIEPPLSIKHFDAWWEIERFSGVEERCESIENSLSTEDEFLLEKTSNRLIDSWIDWLFNGN